MFTETFVPGTIVLGTGAFNPGDIWPRGVTMAWPTCQQGDGYVVLIETVEVPERPLQLVLGGPDRKTLFIPARTSLYAVQLR